jgi:GMP synthase-like glutamine amidotransferase
MSATHRCLVIENDPTDDPRRLGDWLTEAGLTLDVVAAHAGEPVPVELDGYAAVLVLGGEQHVFAGPDGQPGAPWFPALESLLRKAVRGGVPTLGICLGAQLLAVACAGTVAPAVAGLEAGPRLVAKRDAAEADPLFGPVPMLPDVVQWHQDEISELPLGATLLAASPSYPVQAFRIGEGAWGLQFHIECDTEMIASWAGSGAEQLAEVGMTPEEMVSGVDAIQDDLAEVWRPFAHRFAALARGELAPAGQRRRELPLLGH